MNYSKYTLVSALKLPFFVFAVLCGNNAFAQFQGKVYLEDTTITVTNTLGQPLPLAWAGGFNNPQFSMADLDHDHLNDLVVFEKYPAKITTFINRGTAGNPNYVYAPHYAKNFPIVSDYLILADYNCDTIADLFQIGNGYDGPNSGYSVYRGYYNNKQELCFTYYRNLFYSNDLGATPPNNAECIPSDIPAIVDVDNDGDLDFISYTSAGQLLAFYKNMRVEENLPCDSIKIKLKDHCWGKVNQGNVRAHLLAQYCDNHLLQRSTGDANKTTHSGNTPCLFDADGDGDYDYLDGNVSFNDMVFLKNGRAQYGGVDSMVSQDTTWQGNAKIINLPQWPAAFNVDFDCDGKKDILVSPHAEGSSENYKCVWYFKNTGTTSVPAYTFQSDTLLIDKTIDVGSAAYPMFYDYDKDGKPDLFVGNDGYFQTGGTFRSKLAYYRNTSTVGHPSFQLVSKDLLNIFAQNYYGAAPAFGDLDNDGKEDLVLGHNDGSISFYKNGAASGTVEPIWSLQQAILKDQNNTAINVNNNAAPFIYDINKDGKPDLLIGCFSGTIYYYKNVSTAPGQLKLQYDTSKLGNIVIAGFSSKSTPFIGKMDNTGKDYLVCGSDGGAIYRYDGFQNGNTAIPFGQIDNKYSQINGWTHAAPTIADIDGDGKYEMVIGNELGGVTIYHQVLDVPQSVPDNGIANPLQLFPNPAGNDLFIGMSGEKIADDAEAKIYGSMGQLITTAYKGSNSGTITINIAGLAPGMYFCFMKNDGKMYSGSFIKK